MSHPLGLIHYACGHSSPVRGASQTTARRCAVCAADPTRTPVALTGLTVARIMGHTFSYEHLAECELCATCIP